MTEAMACGTVPVVSDIPPSMKVIENGKCGYFFKTGDEQSLAEVLKNIPADNSQMSANCIEQFRNNYSSEAIAEKLLSIIEQIKAQSG